MKGKVNRFNLNVSMFFIISFKENSPTLGNLIWIPIINLVKKPKGKRVILGVDKSVFSGKLRKIPNGRKSIRNPSYCGKFPDVVVKHDCRLPETVISFGIIKK